VLAGITDGDCAVELGAAPVAELPAEPAVARTGSKSATRHQRNQKPDLSCMLSAVIRGIGLWHTEGYGV